MTKASVSAISSENNQLDSKREIVQATMAQIDKAHGKGSIMLLGQSNVTQVSAISTGSILIDNATGIGGLPVGRVIEIFGPEASGKTTLALQTIAQSQKKGGICAFIDAEHALDPSYAQALGININDLIISQPDFGEQALDITEMLVRSNAIDVIVIDSVAALVPKAEVEGDMGDSHMGLQARLMSQALRKLSPLVNKSKTVIIFINQVRQNIGAMAYAPKETTTGGNALKFYSSMRIEVRRLASLKKDDVHYGNKLIIKIVKNKVAVPFKRVEIDLIFSKGISKELDILDAALQAKVIQQSGSWFSYEGQKIAQGREQVSEYLLNNPEVSAKIVHSIKQAPAL